MIMNFLASGISGNAGTSVPVLFRGLTFFVFKFLLIGLFRVVMFRTRNLIQLILRNSAFSFQIYLLFVRQPVVTIDVKNHSLIESLNRY